MQCDVKSVQHEVNSVASGLAEFKNTTDSGFNDLRAMVGTLHARAPSSHGEILSPAADAASLPTEPALSNNEKGDRITRPMQ